MSKPGSITINDIPDIQGLILRGYNFHSIRYVIFSIQDVEGAKAFCDALLPESDKGMSITNAAPWPGNVKPDYCLNIGFTYSGMLKLIGQTNCDTVATACTSELFGIFQTGAVAGAGDIGDIDTSDPQYWWYRNKQQSDGWLLPNPPSSDNSELHIQLTIYTHTPELREHFYAELLAMIPNTSAGQPSVIPAFFKDSDPIIVDGDHNYVHFGYRDSLSQPLIDNPLWNHKPVRLLMGTSLVDDRPVVDTYRFVIRHDAPIYNAHQLLQNGTFAAFRLLHQDVKAFTDFIHSDPTTPPGMVAAKMCGRWLDGTPLVVSPHGEDKTLKDFDFTNFNYHTPTKHQKGPPEHPNKPLTDDFGLLCPYAAHIRRTNPRDDQNVTGNADPTSDAVQHRVLRRASPYGPVYDEHETGEIQRGLVGLFMGADLTNQFEFVMSQWMNAGGFRNPDESPNLSGVDPLFGPQPSDWNPEADAVFEFNVQDAVITPPTRYKQIPGLTRFIRTDGSLYLFFPGITGLKWLSQGQIPANQPVPSNKI